MRGPFPFRLFLLPLLLGCHLPAGAADSYPERPIRLVVPYPPGGAADLIGRMLAKKMSDDLGQQVIVDNRGGGGQVIGTDIVAKATPDGYTFLQASITHSINPALLPKLPYDSIRDFTPISLLASSPLVLVVHPSVPAKSVKDLVSLAKAGPGALNYASSGNGSGGHLAMALLLEMTHARMVHVPYKGAGPALIDLIAGQVQMIITSPLAAMPHVKSGKLRLLGVSSKARTAAMPDVPAISETVPGYEASLWYAFLAPRGIPGKAASRLHVAVLKSLALPDVRAMFAKSGVDVIGSSAKELAVFLQNETAKWRKVIKAAGIRQG